jgi:hypothetical protein
MREKLAQSPLSNVPFQIPANLDDIFGFIDGTSQEVCRPGGPGAYQNALYNRY